LKTGKLPTAALARFCGAAADEDCAVAGVVASQI